MSDPFLCHPCPGVDVTQAFGANAHYKRYAKWGGHEGVDFACVAGTPILAPHDGVIAKVHRNPDDHPYGVHIRLEFKDATGVLWTVILAHLERAAMSLYKGGKVRSGSVLGYSGRSGDVIKDAQGRGGYHLHMGLNRNGQPVNPAQYIIGGV